ncbi:MAG TPA: YetF domain-containing protein, partial [Tepidisphaeraceae bacterium]
YRSKDWENFIQGRPTLLIHHGVLLHHHLKKELLSVRELRVLLRKQGVHDLHEIEEAVLESDGFISITRKGDPEEHWPRCPACGAELRGSKEHCSQCGVEIGTHVPLPQNGAARPRG